MFAFHSHVSNALSDRLNRVIANLVTGRSLQVIYAIYFGLTTNYGTREGTFLFQYLPEKKLKQKELERKSKQ